MEQYEAVFPSGPMGVLLQRAGDGGVVLAGHLCNEDGSPGHASRNGASVGSYLVGLNSSRFRDASMDSVVPTLRKAGRPMRIMMERPSLRRRVKGGGVLLWEGHGSAHPHPVSPEHSPRRRSLLSFRGGSFGDGAGASNGEIGPGVDSKVCIALTGWLQLVFLPYNQADGARKCAAVLRSAATTERQWCMLVKEQNDFSSKALSDTLVIRGVAVQATMGSLPELSGKEGLMEMFLTLDSKQDTANVSRILRLLPLWQDLVAQANGSMSTRCLRTGISNVKDVSPGESGAWVKRIVELWSDASLHWSPPVSDSGSMDRASSEGCMCISEGTIGAIKAGADHPRTICVKSQAGNRVLLLSLDDDAEKVGWVGALRSQLQPAVAAMDLTSPRLAPDRESAEYASNLPELVLTEETSTPGGLRQRTYSLKAGAAPAGSDAAIAAAENESRRSVEHSERVQVFADLELAKLDMASMLAAPAITYSRFVRAAEALMHMGAEEATALPEGLMQDVQMEIARRETLVQHAEDSVVKEASGLEENTVRHRTSKGSPARRRSSDGGSGDSRRASSWSPGGSVPSSRVVESTIYSDCDESLRRQAFILLATRYLPVLGDKLTASTVYDALTNGGAASTAYSSPKVGASTTSGTSSTSKRRLSAAKPDALLRFPEFQKYVRSLHRAICLPRKPWEQICEDFRLRPDEILVRMEEYVELDLQLVASEQEHRERQCSVESQKAGNDEPKPPPVKRVRKRDRIRRWLRQHMASDEPSDAIGAAVSSEDASSEGTLTKIPDGESQNTIDDHVRLSGTLFVTDKNLVFQPTSSKRELAVVPLLSIANIEESSVQMKYLGIETNRDTGLSVVDCEVRRVTLDEDEEEESSNSLHSVFSKSAERADAGNDGQAGLSAFPEHTMSEQDVMVTFIFSPLKDFLLNKGEERDGGRRRVVRHAIQELVAAHRLTQLHFGNFSRPVTVNSLKRALEDSDGELRRLQSWSAINAIRARSLLKATGRWNTNLLVSRRQLDLECRTEGDDTVELDDVFRSFIADPDRSWSVELARFTSRYYQRKDKLELRFREFDRRLFKVELETTLECFFRPVEEVQELFMQLIEWRWPTLSAIVLLLCVLVVWHDMLAYVVPLLLLLNMFVLLGVRSVITPDMFAWLLGTKHREDDEQGEGGLFDTLVGKFRRLQATLGKTQWRMHKWNVYLLKLRSLYTWQDPSRTRLAILINFVAMGVLSAVPYRLLFLGLVVFYFSKPLRDSEPGTFDFARRRFIEGIPVPSPADAVYNVRPVPPPNEAAEVTVEVIGSTAWRNIIARA